MKKKRLSDAEKAHPWGRCVVIADRWGKIGCLSPEG